MLLLTSCRAATRDHLRGIPPWIALTLATILFASCGGSGGGKSPGDRRRVTRRRPLTGRRRRHPDRCPAQTRRRGQRPHRQHWQSVLRRPGNDLLYRQRLQQRRLLRVRNMATATPLGVAARGTNTWSNLGSFSPIAPISIRSAMAAGSRPFRATDTTPISRMRRITILSTMDRMGPYCGDSVKNGPEQCDLGRDNGSAGPDGCSAGCTNPHYCGDSIVDSNLGEECDLGRNNGVSGYACSSSCIIVP